MRSIPDELRHRPFSRAEARALGLSDRMLNARRFVGVFPAVYRHRDHAMSDDDWVSAARLALPGRARLTGLSRIQALGLDFGPRTPVRFVVEGDLHLVPEGIFLHRTKRLPPNDGVDVTAASAFIAYCRRARVIDAIKVGDWLLHHGHMEREELQALALGEQWRDGADEALYLFDRLDGRSRSLPESELRVLLEASGLTAPEPNLGLDLGGERVLGDLVYRRWRTVVEYEGAHHQLERGQYVADIDRYALFRRHDLGYVQVTKEKLSRPRQSVQEVHRELVHNGYDGPTPAFGSNWLEVFARVTDVLGPRRDRRRSSGGARTVS